MAEQGNSQSVGSTTDSSSAQNTMPQMELVSPASIRASSEHQHQQQQPGQEVMMVTTDDYSYKPGLAAASPSFQQQHQLQHHQQQQLHGGGDHDKVQPSYYWSYCCYYHSPLLDLFSITSSCSTAPSTIVLLQFYSSQLEEIEQDHDD
jgi:hypothetical protein